MLRLACLLVIVSMAVLFALLIEPTGQTATLFTFFGTPLAAIGVALGLLSIWRIRREGRR